MDQGQNILNTSDVGSLKEHRRPNTPRARVLVVDDDATVVSGLKGLLSREGYVVQTASDGQQALGIAEHEPPDLVITDLRMPRMDGRELLKKLQDKHRGVPVIVVSASDDLREAVDAMRAGATDYVTKPVDFDALTRSIEHTLRAFEPAGDPEPPECASLGALIGTSQPMRRVYALARQVAESRAVVLITGESGTGKGALARAIHEASARAEAPFVAVHSAALVDTLLESELFGHERGAFTGADKRRAGRFEQAHSGTLFLDEIGEINATTQVKLLRVLQERAFERVGGNDTIHVDVRLIAATSRDLAEEVRRGVFREDLYYRLNVVHIDMPPLRKRGEDVLLLADEFLSRFSRDNGKRIDGFSDTACRRIIEYPWPGNVRELENTIERAVVLCNDRRIEPAHLRLPDQVHKPGCAKTLAEIEREAIVGALESVNWSTAKAADLLGISVRTVQYRLHQYGLAHRRRR